MNTLTLRLLSLSISSMCLIVGGQASAAESSKCTVAKAEHNKQIASGFYNALMRGDIDTLKKLGRPDYRQHNPAYGDTLQGLVDRIHERPAPAAGAPPPAPLQFVRAVSDCEYVVFLRRMGPKPGVEPTPEAERANVDFFRIQDGKVAEHWDYTETFPRGSEPPKNNNGRF
jgi:predicted SnoaL-like aldol condensation-catalyzing enzyme